ncbi:unnamed protein product [Brassicogethes aeneus]|uniref:Sphingomyelin phosphodiesterase n=1 Tax=Brassicogethes aeneus TaxID=1431903 RepID=A0A9P0ATN6_BRAAE|nr:unnamed protein product [Brassicogethes aeneus]
MATLVKVFFAFSLLALCATASLQEQDILRNVKAIAENLITKENDTDETTLPELYSITPHQLKDRTVCDACAIAIDVIISYRRSGANRQSMVEYIKKFCKKFTDWGSIPCDGYAEIEIDTILFIIDNKRNLTPERVCAIYMPTHKCVDPQADKWTVNIPPPLTPNEETSAPPNASETMKILQITDIHYDPDYTPGSEADCGEPLCCQKGAPKSPDSAAGYWGDYHSCDMPWHSIENLMEQVKKEKYDLIYFTGDIISHRSWVTTVENNTKAIKQINQLFDETFPNASNIFPILGNHEPHPTDFYSPESQSRSKISTQWVFDLVADEWSRWLPAHTKPTIKKGGFYTVLVKKGIRVVALNSNVCYKNNLWLIYDDKDPNGQLQWLVDVLAEAEKNKEKVHVLSHIPPGEVECHRQWSNQFRRIVERFSETITAQFNGHTHYDELRVFFNGSKVINVAFNGGSFTTYTGLNPNYRIYIVDKNNFNVVDFDNFVFNMTEANLQNDGSIKPRWFKLYSFKQAYGLDNTGSTQMANLVDILRRNEASIAEYFKYRVKDSDPLLKEGCDRNCLKQLVCSITAVETDESLNC